MEVVLVIHLLLALAIIGLVLMQRSEGGGLGIGGGSGGGAGNFASARGTANFLTRMTAICAGLFFVTSLVLGVMAGRQTTANQGILSSLDSNATPAAIEAPLNIEGETTAEDGAVLSPSNEQTDAVETDDGEMPSAPIAE